MNVMMPTLIASDLEGVFLPEIWIAVSEKTGIAQLSLTTRDVADYDELMQMRLRILAEHGRTARIVSFHTVKPLDEACLAEAFAKFPLVVTCEEHSKIGGFGSAVTEWAADNGADARKLLHIGTPDKFFKLSGEQEFAREQLGLTGHQIAHAIEARLAKRQAA